MASSLEINKVLAAILTAGIVASGSGVISRIIYQVEVPEEPAYPIAVAEGEAAGGEAAPAEQAQPIAVLLAGADVGAGETAARACAACHTFEEGGANRIGPNLWGVVGRDIASVPNFSYSDALASKEGAWDYESLSAFLESPREWAPGTKMSFAGLRDDEERADVVLYLRSLAADPEPLPEPTAAETEGAAQADAAAGEQAATQGDGEGGAEADQTAAAAQAEGEASETAGAGQAEGEATQTAAVDGGIVGLLAQADPAAGEKAASKCAACHSFEEGGPNKIGPVLHDVVGRDVASVEGFSYSGALQEKKGVWDYQSLNAFLADPREWAPGTKMAFVGIKKDEERADVIAYLRSITDDPPPLPSGG